MIFCNLILTLLSRVKPKKMIDGMILLILVDQVDNIDEIMPVKFVFVLLFLHALP